METVEFYPRYFGFAWLRLLRYPRIHLHLGDSRSFLEEVTGRTAWKGRPVFYYLDAHWSDDLPLKEELETIFSRSPEAVVMIDDFKVPDDSGYRFDEYGPGRALDLEYVSQARTPSLATFFPAVPSEKETGSKRGCVILAHDASVVRTLRTVTSLREWPSR